MSDDTKAQHFNYYHSAEICGSGGGHCKRPHLFYLQTYQIILPQFNCESLMNYNKHN